MKDVSPEVEARGPIAWMARNPIAANLLMVMMILGGVWSASNMQKEVEPEFQLDIVRITVTYPGASPAEVETGIVLPVEEAVRGVQGIKEISSEAREGRGVITIELVAGAERMIAFQDIDQAVGRIRTFPGEVDEPEVRLEIQQRQVMEVGIFGDVDPWTLRVLAERLRDQLVNHSKISQVEIRRVPEYVTHVEISSNTLRKHGLTLADVSKIISDSSQDVPAGDVQALSGEILLRMNERKQWAEEFQKIPIVKSDAGATLTLGEIATVTDGFEEQGFHSQFNATPSVEVNIFRIGKQSPLEISEAVHEILDDFRVSVPEGVTVRVNASAADDYDDRLSLLLENAAMAIIIVLLILALFLEIRLAFWVMMGMVLSFIGAMILLPVVGVSINMVSMFGFLVALGIVVDDAIVIGENIYEKRETTDLSRIDAAIFGAKELARPVTFTILTSVVAFVPLLFMPGTTGKYWWPLPAVVITILLVSLVEALFVLPAHLGHGKEKTNPIELWLDDKQQRFAAFVNHMIANYFGPLLGRALQYRYVTLVAAISLLIVVGGFGYSGHVGMVLMPEVAADEIECGVRLPVGTTPKQAALMAAQITDSTLEMFEKHDLYQVADGVKTNIRRGSFIDVEIVMKPPDERNMTANQVIALWRDEIGDIEGVSQMSFEAERGPGGHRQDIEVDLSHTDEETLAKASAAFVERLERFEATRDVNDTYDRGKKQLDFTLRAEGSALGLTSTMVGQQVRDAFFGSLSFRQLRGTNEIEVRVKLPEDEREDLHTLEDFIIRAPNGAEVPLFEVVDVRETYASSRISRRDTRRVVTVSTDVEPKNAVTRVINGLQDKDLPELRADFPGLTWSFEGSQAELRDSTRTLWGGFALAMILVYALLAIAFRSYAQPLLVLVAIPFGVIGAVIGHLMLGHDLSLMSVMGMIALSGVVVNDSLIMIDYANRNRGDLSAFEAIYQAGIRRFRPILLTTLTTFGGLTPIIIETSNQANQLIPMAISLGFGIVFATAIILLLVPALYLILEDFQNIGRVERV